MNRKNRIRNLIMILLSALIVIGGILAAGHLRGWFGSGNSAYTVTAKTGIVQVTRGGLAFTLDSDSELKDGDEIAVSENSQLTISGGTDTYTAAENTELQIDGHRIRVVSGELWITCGEETDILVGDGEFLLKKGTYDITCRTGSEELFVLAGSAACGDQTCGEGEALVLVDKTCTVDTFAITSLDDFALRMANEVETGTLCFTGKEIEEEISLRSELAAASLEENLNSETADSADKSSSKTEGDVEEKDIHNGTEETDAEETEDSGKTKESNAEASEQTSGQNASAETSAAAAPSTGSSSAGSSSAGTSSAGSASAGSGGSSQTADSGKTQAETTASASASPTTAPTAAPETAASTAPAATFSCTIEVRCDTVLDHMSELSAAKQAVVPADGVILQKVTVSFTEGETVYDILTRACGTAGIPLEASYTPGFGSAYVEGIGNLCEFDCGQQSGWIYKVNGYVPNYGCSSYKVSNGDVIAWHYTCTGYGADVTR